MTWPSPRGSRFCAALALAQLALGCAPEYHSRRPPPLPPHSTMEGVMAPSLRGLDEVAEAPDRPARSRPPVFWFGPPGQRTFDGWPKQSASIGSPNRGRLHDGHPLPEEGPGWIHRPRRSHGTDELIAVIKWGLWRVLQQFPGTVPAFIGDLSDDTGGRAPPHRSHQSGRDVDIGYYLAHNTPARSFVQVEPDTMDVEKTWALIEGFLATGMVRFLFINYRLQGALYEAAQRFGWGDSQLDIIFQYPRGPNAREGIIRHARGHGGHMHLRIVCPVGDDECVD